MTPRPRGRPRKHPVPDAGDFRVIPAAEFNAAVVAGCAALANPLPETPAEPVCTGRVRWKGSSGAHPRGALQVAWQCAGGIEWRPIEFAHADAPDTEDAPT